jgi:hypothetical protein
MIISKGGFDFEIRAKKVYIWLINKSVSIPP